MCEKCIFFGFFGEKIFEKNYLKNMFLPPFHPFFFEKSKLSLTYDGKSIYLDFNEDEEDFYITQVGFPDFTENTKVFLAELSKFNIKVKEETIKPFITIWSNGSDCPLNLLTGDEITKGY